MGAGRGSRRKGLGRYSFTHLRFDRSQSNYAQLPLFKRFFLVTIVQWAVLNEATIKCLLKSFNGCSFSKTPWTLQILGTAIQNMIHLRFRDTFHSTLVLRCTTTCSPHILNKFRNCSFSSYSIVVSLPVRTLRLQVRWNGGGNPDKVQTSSQTRIQRFHQVLPLCLGPVYSEFGLDLRPVSP